ncbi:hypothetical protein BO94DRAFT_624475 [Aspergillus sclerotioniger CBS 115572]|uniref:P-loop containing nucleoside triphosphate hydrolase protein n=1 Tax=Aspergillus sclerotioniger CBS 115572 TaxID=1450535 RepID=A0A317WLF0_9EURO|nr:hypothetical protein BO94DRAFT_624475 [Aspergillus sclerotioniger CBS 115572]PWY87304.1 hypothetical protein BO94DRAFT_624475 [Aspergillus sclerotioniger CBS 115572]
MPPPSPPPPPPAGAEPDPTPKTTIIGLSGPSSSGKTTLARLLQSIFSKLTPTSTTNPSPNPTTNLKTFIVHEDDFYHSDDKIPLTPHPRAPHQNIQNWDTLAAINTPFLTSSLQYIKSHGRLPPRLRSKEDLNDVVPPDVSESVIEELRGVVRRRVPSYYYVDEGSGGDDRDGDGKRNRTIVFLEGFLLFAPPRIEAPEHGLRDVNDVMDVRLFLPARYENVKERREGRSGYVTIGPAPTVSNTGDGDGDGDGDGGEVEQKGEEKEEAEGVDLEKEDDGPPQNFWTDPPGYVDDIVWPNYVQDHAWLLLPEEGSQRLPTVDTPELVHLVGQGVNLRTDAGVTVAPGQGTASIVDILKWAVEEVLKHIEETEEQ